MLRPLAMLALTVLLAASPGYTQPGSVRGDGWLDLTFSVDRATRAPGDKRDLGLIWGTVSLQQ